jgi:transcriptional regulator with XRE-family HTH domain
MLNWKLLVDQAIAVRRQEGLSQRDLAALAGVTQPTIVKFEKGSTGIRVDSALAILRALGLAESAAKQ